MKFHKVMVAGGRVLDIPGCKYRIIYKAFRSRGGYLPLPLFHR